MINEDRNYCFRITHIRNLPFMLERGIVSRRHPQASAEYIHIGNPEIIDVRSSSPVRISGYGMIGDYVPFYFTPRSMMLYNIVTGYYEPKVPRRNKAEILVIRCLIERLSALPGWFFTDGQANDMASRHYNDTAHLDKIDWDSIRQSNFSKNDGDFDRPRRYQAEFLVKESVPLSCVESLNVYNEEAAAYVQGLLDAGGIQLPLHIQPEYFF